MRHITDAATGEALENLEMPVRVNLSGPKADGKDRCYCRGGHGGRQRTSNAAQKRTGVIPALRRFARRALVRVIGAPFRSKG
jgi:hypothetical protein